MRIPLTAATGLALWIVLCLWLRPELMVVLLLVGPLTIVPLCLELMAPPRGWQAYWSALRWLQLAAALAVVVSFRLPEGLAAAAWTAPWLAGAAIMALAALLRFLQRRGRPVIDLGIDAGLAFVFVGAFWLTVSRSGYSFLGFGNPIALLTAAHFNLAGIAVPLLASLAARTLGGRLSTVTVLASVSGLPVVATGITLQAQGVPHVNTLAVAYFSVGMLLLSFQHARLALRGGPVAPRALWAVAAIALPIGMVLAMAYAAAPWTGHSISIDLMLRTHAIINVFGFALPAVLAWWLARPMASPASPSDGSGAPAPAA